MQQLIVLDNKAELEDRSYQSLNLAPAASGVSSAAAINCANTWVINNATQGLANYLIKTFPEKAKAGQLSGSW